MNASQTGESSNLVPGENGEQSRIFGDNIFLNIIIIIGIIVGILLILFLIRKFIQGGQYRKKNRIDGKIVIITGCNAGIGKETALELAKRGAKIYMACRDPKRCEDARLEIVEKSKNVNVFNRTLDLASFESIQNFVAKFLQDESRLDILINNAGVMAMPKTLTKEGFEMQIGVNHFGHFYLTKLLLETLKASAPSRIVVVSSLIAAIGKIKKDDLNSEKSYNKFAAYNQSKLANILFTRQLATLLHGTNVTVNCLHPGLVKTELGRNFVRPIVMRICSPLISYFFKTAKSGAQTSIHLAINPDLEKVSGQYFSDCIKMPVPPHCRDEEMARWLWDTSEELVERAARNLNSNATVNK